MREQGMDVCRTARKTTAAAHGKKTRQTRKENGTGTEKRRGGQEEKMWRTRKKDEADKEKRYGGRDEKVRQCGENLYL